MKRTFLVLTFLVSFLHNPAFSQTQLGFVMPPDQDKVSIPFEEYNNLVVIPVILNNLLRLKFVLDTGVETPILTEEGFARILGIDYIREIAISGIGIQDSIKAYVGQKVDFILPGGIVGHNLNLLVLQDDYLKLSEKMGDEVYGILGYDIFKQFVVEIDYDEKVITLYRHGKFKPRKKMGRQPMEVVQSKPFISTIMGEGKQKDTIRLMIDTGASHAVLLDTKESSITIPEKTVPVRLGTGLAGEIPGKLGRISRLELNNLEFNDVIVSFPEPDAYSQSIKRGSRQGTIGGEILSRLHPIFDYQNQMLYFKKAWRFDYPFEFDMSGLALASTGSFLDSLIVEYVRPDSPGYFANVKEGDVVLSVNGIKTSLASTQVLFKKRPNYKIKVRLLRNGEKIKKSFRLKRAI